MTDVNPEILSYLNADIIPQYRKFDSAHTESHVTSVMESALAMCRHYDVNQDMIAVADRQINPETVIRRTIQYSLAHYPALDREGHWKRTVGHLHEKYADGGYLKLWIPLSPNAERLERLREIIRDEKRLRSIFEEIYYQEHGKDFS